MAQVLFAHSIEKKDVRKQSWKGIPRVSFTRPAVASKVDPITPETHCEVKRQTRESLKIGTIVIILDGELKGRRGVVVADKGAGIVAVGGIDFDAKEIDQDYLIATSTKLEIGNVSEANAKSAIEAAAGKVEEMVDYLKSTFSLKKGDRPHLMKF